MSHALVLVTAPTSDPVAVADVKNYLRIDTSVDDAMLTSFISAATRVIEKYLNRRLITQTWDFYMDRFPAAIFNDALMSSDGVTTGRLSEFLSQKKFIEIPYFPLQSVTYLKTFDDSNNEYTMSSSDYYVDQVSEPGRLSLKNDTT